MTLRYDPNTGHLRYLSSSGRIVRCACFDQVQVDIVEPTLCSGCFLTNARVSGTLGLTGSYLLPFNGGTATACQYALNATIPTITLETWQGSATCDAGDPPTATYTTTSAVIRVNTILGKINSITIELVSWSPDPPVDVYVFKFFELPGEDFATTINNVIPACDGSVTFGDLQVATGGSIIVYDL